MSRIPKVHRLSLLLLLFAAALVLGACSVPPKPVQLPQPENMMINPTFEGAEEQIPPQGWAVYGQLDDDRKISVIDADDPARRALLIEDHAAVSGKAGEIGLTQTVPGGPGKYQATLTYRSVEGLPQDGSVFFQVRFLPSETLKQVPVSDVGDWPTDDFRTISVEGVAPADTENVRIYLYTGQTSTVAIAVQSINLYKIE